MAITNYTNLQTAIGDFLNRDDLTSVIPTFIQLAEAQMNRDIRHWKMETRAQAQQSAGDEYVQVPSDWLETIRFHLTGNGTHVLDLISRAAMADKREGVRDMAGRPDYFCHADSQFQLFPTPDAEYDLEILYYAKIPALSGTTTTNWLLEDSPDVYLYGSLLHSAPYLQEDARAATWGQMYAAVVANLNEASRAGRYSGSGLTLKIRGLG